MRPRVPLEAVMCHLWEGNIERCQHCSETDYQNLCKMVRNVGRARPAHQLVARMAQHHLSRDHPQPSRPHSDIDQYGNSTARSLSNREQALTHNTRTSSSRHDAPLGQQTQRNHQLGRGQRESHHQQPSSSRQHTVTDLADKSEHQASSEKTSENDTCKENMEVLTARMNKLPPPCWGDEQLMLPLVREQLMQEEFYRRQAEQLDDIWGMYAKEREVLAAPYHSPEPETWTPEFEEEEILERETPLWDEIWERCVQQGEACMRDVLDEDENWPRRAPEEADIWTRELDGMLTAASLRRLVPVFTLQELLREGGLERSDESRRASSSDKG